MQVVRDPGGINAVTTITYDTLGNMFEYTARWGSVGLDCTHCTFQSQVKEWPDVNKSYSCKKHNLSLKAELNEDGYKEGEWFCQSFQNNGSANVNALNIFNKIKSNLAPDILYGLCGADNNLKEIPFSEL